MASVQVDANDPQVQAAIEELKQCISRRFPTARYAVTQGVGEDTEGIYLMTTVDVDDPDEVLDVVMDQLLQFEVDLRLPLYVLPIRTPERIAADLAARPRRGRAPVVQLW